MADIIEDIFCRTNLMYVSELHEERNYGPVLHAVRELKEQDYTQAEWAEAYQYIVQDEPGYQQSREGLIRFLDFEIMKRKVKMI